MIRIENFNINIENKYFIKKETEILQSLKKSTINLDFKKWVKENLESLLLGYKTEKRNREGRNLKSLDDLNIEVNKRFSHLFINNNLYEINHYFNRYLTTNKESMFYKQEIEVNEAKEFLISFDNEEYHEEKKIFIEFLNKIEKKTGKEKLDLQKEELRKILIHEVFKNEWDKGIRDYLNFNKRLQKINDFENNLNKYKDKNLNNLLKDKNIEELQKIFNYSTFTNDKNYGRHKIISSLNISVCPYCNRQYITNYEKDNNNKTTADLDHYYPKTKYPYLALSLYNFIPSCQICNSRMKGNKEGHLYPYNEEFGDRAVFRTTAQSLNGLLNSDADKFEIEIKRNKDKIEEEEKKNKGYEQRLEKSIKEVFKLDKVYKKSHNKYILDMLHTIEHYPDSYLDTIADIFKVNSNDYNKEQLKKELRNLLRKPYEDRIDKQDTLAKLTEDILKEYGVL